MEIKDLPVGDAPAALEFSYFPTRFLAVIWRNWNLVAPEKLASLLQTSVENIEKCASLMGLKRDDAQLELWKNRGFQTIIRRNWELLDYDQILEILDWTADQLFFTLKEDDFFFYKLGLHKPQCGKVVYRELTPEETARAGKIGELVSGTFAAMPPKAEAPFDFLKNYGKALKLASDGRQPDFDLKFSCSYAALYGDPLMEDDCASYPEGFFADCNACGINAVWIQATLYTLVPYLGENEPYSKNHQIRMANLKMLVDRAARYGVKIFLYLNEPRSMPAEFFERHPEWRGVAGDQDDFALCTSAPGVLETLSNGIERLFREIPDLGGTFTITNSENLTHCRSRNKCCPRCESSSLAQLIAGVNKAIAAGVKRSGSKARVIAYTWAWPFECVEEIVREIGPDVTVMCVSESRKDTDCFNFKGQVSDYSISKVGPGSNSRKVWDFAKKYGNPAAAKVQINASWELSAVPYIPVPDLVEQHLNNLSAAGVSDLMLGWTLGGYPGGNMGLLRCSKESLAGQLYGSVAPTVLKAWQCFSEAFSFFPFHNVPVIYFAPQNFGPSVLLMDTRGKRTASMVGFPFDDIATWCGEIDNPANPALEKPMPRHILRDGFEAVSSRWKTGLSYLQNISGNTPAENDALRELINVATACYCHFRSAYCQIEIVLRRQASEDFRRFILEERELALTLLQIVRQDSRIGFEASNHYFYVENDLLEKILNCDDLLDNAKI